MINEPIHICHIVYRFATGGLENGMVNLINKLPPSEFKHSIVCISDSDPKFAERISREGVSIYHLNKPPGRSLSYLIQLRKILKALKPDIVHSRNLSTLESQLAGVGLGAKRVHGEHGWDSANGINNRKHQLIRRLVKPIIDQYIVLSDESFHYLKNKILVKPNVINTVCNGVDRNKFYCGVKANKEIIEILAVGRLAEVKNFPLLINAMAKLVYELDYKNISLTIIGDGPMRAQLNAQICSLNLQRYCSLPGDSSEIPRLLNDSDIFVLPSTAEGISNTILEAMSTGTAVIATDVGGNSELVVDKDTGIIIPSNDLAALVNAIRTYIERRELSKEHGKNGRHRVDQLFSIELMIDRYSTIYHRLIGR